MADREKDTRDILLSWSLLLPTLLGMVKANRNLPQLAELQDRLLRYLRGQVSISEAISGRKAIEHILSKDVRFEELVQSRQEALKKHLTGQTRDEVATSLGRPKPIREVIAKASTDEGSFLIFGDKVVGWEQELTIHTRDSLRRRYEAVERRLKTLQYTTTDRGEVVWKVDPDSGPTRQDMLSTKPEIIRRRMELRSWLRAYHEAGQLSYTGNISELSLFDLHQRLAGFDRSPETANIDVLKRYVNELERLEEQLYTQKINEPVYSKSATVSPVFGGSIKPHVISVTGGKPVSREELELKIKQSLHEPAPPGGGFQTTFRDVFYNYSNQARSYYDTIFSPDVQARDVAKVFMSMQKHLGELKRGGADKLAAKLAEAGFTKDALKHTIENMEVRLEVTEEHLLGRPLKYFKFVFDTGSKRLGKMLGNVEFYFPTAQQGYLVTHPGISPTVAPAVWPAGAKRTSQFMSISSILALDMVEHMPKFYNELLDAMFRGEKAQNMVMRMINRVMQQASPEKGTAADFLKMGATRNIEGMLYSGLLESREYVNAMKAQSVIENVRQMNTAGRTGILVFDTEYAKPGLLERAHGVQRMAGDPFTRIWSVGYQILDYESRTGTMPQAREVYIKPKNWNDIKRDVQRWLRRQLGDDQKRIEDILKKVEGQGKSLEEFLRILERDIKTFGKERLYVAGFNSTDADLKQLSNMIDTELDPRKARMWKERLGYLLDRDLTSGARRQIDIMHLYRGWYIGAPWKSSSNSAVFEELFGLDSTRFGELLDKVKGSERLNLEAAAKEVWGKDVELAKVTHAFKTFENMRLGVQEFHSHTASYDMAISSMSMFKLFDKLDRPTQLDRAALTRLEAAARIYRNRLAGHNMPWHQVPDVILNPLFSPHYMVSSFDETGKLMSPDTAQMSLFSMTKTQASRMLGSIFNLDRLLPGGMLHNLLRQKYQALSGHVMSVDAGLLYNQLHSGLTEGMQKADLPLFGLGSMIDTVHGEAMHQQIVNEYITAYGNMRKSGYFKATLGEDALTAVDKAGRGTKRYLTDRISGLVAYLPDSHGFTYDASGMVNKAMVSAITMLGQGTNAGTRTMKLTIPLHDKFRNAPKEAIHEALQKRGFHPAIQRLAQMKGGTVGNMLANPGKKWDVRSLTMLDEVGKRGVRELIVNPYDVLLEGVKDMGRDSSFHDVGTMYDKNFSAILVGLTIDQEEGSITLTFSEQQRPALGTKTITGSGMATKATVQAYMGKNMPGTEVLMQMASMKSTKDYGSFVMAQIERVVRKIYTDHPTSLADQKRAFKKAMAPLLGEDIAQSLQFTTTEIGTTGGSIRKVIKPRFTDIVQGQLSSHGAGLPRIYDMLKAAGMTIDEVQKFFNIVTERVYKTPQEQAEGFKNLARKQLNSIKSSRDSYLTEIVRLGDGRSKSEIRAAKAVLDRQIKALERYLERGDKTGTMLFDFFAYLPWEGSTAHEFHSAIISMTQQQLIEASPVDYLRPFKRMESFYGVPLGPQKLNPLDAQIFEDAIRRVTQDNVAAGLEMVAGMDEMRGFAYISRKTGTPVLREAIQSVHMAMEYLQTGRPDKAAALGDEGTVKIMNMEAMEQALKDLGFLSEEGVDPRRMSRILADLGIQGATKEMSQNELGELLARHGIHGPDVQYFSEVLSQDNLHLVDRSALNEIDLFKSGGMKGLTMLQVENLSRSIKEMEKKHGNHPLLKRLKTFLTKRGQEELYQEGFWYDLEEHIFDRLVKDLPQTKQRETRIVVEQLSAHLKQRAESSSVRVGTDLIPIPRGVIALSVLQSPNMNRILDGKAMIAGPATASMNIMSDLHSFNQSIKDLVGFMDEKLSMKNMKDVDIRSMDEKMYNLISNTMSMQKSMANLYSNVLGPTISQLIQKAYTLYSPTSYGKIHSSFHLLPTLQKIYSTGIEEVMKDYPTEEIVRIGDVEHKINVKRALAELVDSGKDINKAQLFESSSSKAGMNRILFKGLGLNETIIPFSVAKNTVLDIATRNGGRLPEHMDKGLMSWLRGEKPWVMGVGRQPLIFHGPVNLAQAYVVPDVVFQLHGVDIDVNTGRNMDVLNGYVFMDLVSAYQQLADRDGDLGFYTMLGDNITEKAIQKSRQRTAELVRFMQLERQRQGEISILPDKLDNVELGFDTPYDEKTGRVTFMVPDRHYKDVIDKSALDNLFPMDAFYDQSEHTFRYKKTSMIDEYLTQKLVTGRIGQMHKYFISQSTGMPSAWEQLSNYLKDDMKSGGKVAKILQEHHQIDSQAVIEALHRLRQQDKTVGMTHARILEMWSGNLVERIGIKKLLDLDKDIAGGVGRRMNKELINETLDSFRDWISRDMSDGTMERLAIFPEKKAWGLRYFYTDRPFENYTSRELKDLDKQTKGVLQDANKVFRTAAIISENIEKKPTSFGVLYQKKALDANLAMMYGQLGYDFSIMSGISTAASWEDIGSGIIGKENMAYTLEQLRRGFAESGRRPVLEMLRQSVRERVGEAGYQSLSKNVKLAGLAALALIAIDPNANSKLLGPMPGVGGEKYDLPTIQSLIDVYRQKKPQLLEPSAPMMDKLAHLAGLPQETLPQLKQERALPPRPKIYYNNRRENFSRHNLKQYIREGNGVLLT